MLKWLKQKYAGNKVNDAPPAASLDPKPDFNPEMDLTQTEIIERFDDIAKARRERGIDMCPLANGGYLLISQDAVQQAFTSDKLVNSPSKFSTLHERHKDRYVAASVAANIPPFLDGHRHVEIRRWLSKAFFQRLTEFKPELEERAEIVVSKFESNQQYLLVEEIAREFVCDAICRFVGIPASVGEVKEYTSALFKLFAPARSVEVFAETNSALSDARKSLKKHLQLGRDNQRPSLLAILEASAEGLAESKNDLENLIVDNALLILADGVENVEAAIGAVVLTWSNEGRPKITENFVRQVIQNQTPGQTIPRIAATDFSFSGQHLKAGTPVFLSLASANHAALEKDPAGQEQQYSFGLGRHRCIGEALGMAMIVTYCQKICQTIETVDGSNLRYENMFGHKWIRDVTCSIR